MSIFFCLQSGRCREVQLYILNNELLLGAKTKKERNQTVITVKVYLLRDLTTETKR